MRTQLINLEVEKTARHYSSNIQGHVTYLIECLPSGRFELYLKSYLDNKAVLCKVFHSLQDYMLWLLDKHQPNPLKDFEVIHSKNYHLF